MWFTNTRRLCPLLIDTFISSLLFPSFLSFFPFFLSSETDAKPVSFARVLSEVLYWCRPVVYAFLRLVSPENSWTPFFGSILVDIIARKLAGDLRDLSPAQVEQWAVRTRGYLYYLVRSPLFETVTIRPFKAAADMLAPLPLVGSVLSVVVETAIALQRHHFYTSNS